MSDKTILARFLASNISVPITMSSLISNGFDLDMPLVKGERLVELNVRQFLEKLNLSCKKFVAEYPQEKQEILARTEPAPELKAKVNRMAELLNMEVDEDEDWDLDNNMEESQKILKDKLELMRDILSAIFDLFRVEKDLTQNEKISPQNKIRLGVAVRTLLNFSAAIKSCADDIVMRLEPPEVEVKGAMEFQELYRQVQLDTLKQHRAGTLEMALTEEQIKNLEDSLAAPPPTLEETKLMLIEENAQRRLEPVFWGDLLEIITEYIKQADLDIGDSGRGF